MYPHMQSWVAYLKNTSKDLLRGPTLTHCFGDWLSIDADTPREVIQTAHFAYATNITRQAAEALGRTEDAASYATLFSDIRTAFNNAFVQGDGTITGNTQTAYLMALKFGLLDTGKAAQAADRLVANIRAKKNHLSTGFIGTALIMSVLRDTGHLDLAYRLLENTTFPSWGYSVVNGATSIWERWNGWIKETGPGDVNMNSYSHYAYGAVVEWLFDTVAGIDHGVHGFRHFILRPQPGGHLDHAAAEFHSPYGRIRSAWRRQGKGFAWETTIPANTCATVYIPARKQGSVTLNGKKLKDQEHAELDGNGGILLKAGEYAFTW
jgi:alpha-L-rhamnosidase